MAARQRQQGRAPSRHNRARAEALVWMGERYLNLWASGYYQRSQKTVADTLYTITMAAFDA
jgi:hypothetical protein